jgi:hypothetical protein
MPFLVRGSEADTPHGPLPLGTCTSRQAMLDEDIMFKLRTIGHFVLRAGSLQASPPAPGVRGA